LVTNSISKISSGTHPKKEIPMAERGAGFEDLYKRRDSNKRERVRARKSASKEGVL